MVMAVFNGRAMTKQSDGTLKVVPGAHIEVRSEIPGLPLAALKSDRDGTTPKTNPFDADADGKFSFYVTGGAYQIRAYTGSSGAPDTEDFIYHVAVGLNAESDSIARVPRVVTVSGTAAAGASDTFIVINKTVGEASPVTVCASADFLGDDLTIKDGKGDAATNNITLSFDGAETCDGMSTVVISTNYGMVRIKPNPDGGWLLTQFG